MIELKPTEVDDPQFVELASQVLNRLIRLHSPQEIYAIQIDHWFDHKWLNKVRGISRVEFDAMVA